jgi:hypothetical protein
MMLERLVPMDEALGGEAFKALTPSIRRRKSGRRGITASL